MSIFYFDPSYLQRIGKSIGKFIREDEKTFVLQLAFQAWICVELDVSKPLPQYIFIGESKEYDFWQKLEYEGNNAFCTKCGLLGHIFWDSLQRRI